jgi:hypothetical protein
MSLDAMDTSGAHGVADAVGDVPPREMETPVPDVLLPQAEQEPDPEAAVGVEECEEQSDELTAQITAHREAAELLAHREAAELLQVDVLVPDDGGASLDAFPDRDPNGLAGSSVTTSNNNNNNSNSNSNSNSSASSDDEADEADDAAAAAALALAGRPAAGEVPFPCFEDVWAADADDVSSVPPEAKRKRCLDSYDDQKAPSHQLKKTKKHQTQKHRVFF